MTNRIEPSLYFTVLLTECKYLFLFLRYGLDNLGGQHHFHTKYKAKTTPKMAIIEPLGVKGYLKLSYLSLKQQTHLVFTNFIDLKVRNGKILEFFNRFGLK